MCHLVLVFLGRATIVLVWHGILGIQKHALSRSAFVGRAIDVHCCFGILRVPNKSDIAVVVWAGQKHVKEVVEVVYGYIRLLKGPEGVTLAR